MRGYEVLVSEFSLVSLDTNLLETVSAFITLFHTVHFSVNLSKRLGCWFQQVPIDLLKSIFKKNAARSLQKLFLFFFMYKIPPFAADSSKAVNKIFEEFYKNIKTN